MALLFDAPQTHAVKMQTRTAFLQTKLENYNQELLKIFFSELVTQRTQEFILRKLSDKFKDE